MTTRNPTRRARIGVVHRGVVVAERVLDRRCDVSVGRRLDATIQIDRGGLPDKLDVLRLVDGRYHVVLPRDPSAQLTLRGAPVSDVTVHNAGERLVPIEQCAGGSLAVGDLVVMFQLVRAPAETLAVREETVLRIGLVFEGRLISDQIFSDRRKVCVGRGRRDRVVLDADYQGPSLCFSRTRSGEAVLEADPDAALRVALPSREPTDLDALLGRGAATRRGRRVQLPLALGARGRARLGPYTVLFQVIRRRAVVPVLEQPGLIRGAARAVLSDPVWSTSLGLAAILVCGVLAQALVFHDQVGRFQSTVAAPEEPDRDRLYEVAVAELEPPKPEAPVLAPPEPEARPEPKPAAKAPKVKKAPPKKPKARAKPVNTASRQVDPTEHRRNVRRAVLRRTIAGELVGRTGGGLVMAEDPADADVFGSVGPGERGAGADGEGPSAGVKLAGATGGGSVEKVAVDKARRLKSGNKALVAIKVKKKRPPTVKVDINPAPFRDGGNASGERVGRVVHRKRNAVRRCYENALKKDATLSGKLVVSFTVGTAGTVTHVRISGLSGRLDACVTGVFKRIRGLPLLSAPAMFKQAYVLTGGGA